MQVSPKVQRAEILIKAAETAIMTARRAQTPDPDAPSIFLTTAPNNGIYGSTPPQTFLRVVDQCDIPSNSSLKILGAGVGRDGYYSSERFREVVGFEADPILYEYSVAIQRQLASEGYHFPNLQFRNENFLESDLSDSDVIVTFQPFLTNFLDGMMRRFINTPKETIIITLIQNRFREILFARSTLLGRMTEKIYPEHESPQNLKDPDLMTFYAYRRT